MRGTSASRGERAVSVRRTTTAQPGFTRDPRASLDCGQRVLNVTGTVACHPWLGADFHCRSVFIAAWSKYGFPVDVTIWIFVTFPCGSNVNRKRPVPAWPG